MKTKKVEIFFEDQVPRFKCGQRRVTVRIGYKWVRLEDCMGRRARIRLDLYRRLRPVEVQGK